MTFGLCAGAGRVQAGEAAASAGVRASDFPVIVAWSRAGSRPGVHSADINELAVEATSGDRWNSAVVSWCVVPVRGLMSAPWTPGHAHDRFRGPLVVEVGYR